MSTEAERKQRREDPVYQAELLKRWRAEAILENERTLENARAHDRIMGGDTNERAVKLFTGGYFKP